MLMQRDLSQMNYRERVAHQQQVKYVHLKDGTVGLVSNSAGLCMA